ncbi:MAG: rhamnulokinase, partial [Clostridia bacterium]|nr:rhamnulokinase [Clostridia bacterium]
NLTTGALIDALSGEIDRELLSTLGIKSSIFGAIYTPGEFLGGFNEETKRLVGFDSKVVICATHDTASAVAACPINKRDMYISSGTWSLIGTELRAPVLTPEAMNSGYTNEGGVEKTYRFLKNIMGMWLLQGIRRELGKKYSYDEMMHMAMDSEPCGYFNPNAKELVAPESMIGAIRLLLNKPEATLGELLASVYHSLAISYREAMLAQEKISGRKTERICIIGGGSKDRYLNSLTAHYTKKRVVAGPVEATAIGNLILQMISDGKFDNISAARDAVRNSFNIEEIRL